jgi:RimJ/RimL family protein N-acetyltransferase
MLHVHQSELRAFSDNVRGPDGRSLTIRFVEPEDIERLQAYFRSLSREAHYNRFQGAVQELPKSELDRILRIGDERRFAVVVEMLLDGRPVVVGEARYAFDRALRKVEFGMSIADAWHRMGFGSALLANMECRAAAFGADSLFGEALRTNVAMVALARKAGFSFKHAPDDWRLVRFEKDIRADADDIPCAGVRRIAATLAAAG